MRTLNQRPPVRAKKKAFTLVEVIVAATLFVITVGLVMGMVISQTKFGIAIGNYSDMNEYSRKVVSQLEKDMRLARTITTISPTALDANIVPSTLSLEDAVQKNPTTVQVVYTYDKDAQKLFRESPKGGTRTVVLDNLVACQFMYFNKNDTPVTDMTRTPDVKKVLISATMRRTSGGISNTDYLVSAVVTLRSRP
jgi:hypothetical protein